MKLRAAILILVLLVLPAGAQNFMLRWTPLQWTNWVRQFSGSGTGSVAGLQWGSQNLTNLSTVGLGLTNLLKVHAVAPGTNITIQTNGGVWTVNAPPSPAVLTNVVWQRLTNYEQTLYIDIAFDGANNTAFWTNYNGLSNQWFSFTATSNTTLKIELENVWRNEATNALESSDSVAYLWGSWETPNYTMVLFNFVENATEKFDEIDTTMVNTRAGPDYTFESDGISYQAALVRRSMPVTIRSGTTLRLYQGWELSREVGNPGATNYFVGSVWVQREQRFLTSP
jgi:hypothetical protein